MFQKFINYLLKNNYAFIFFLIFLYYFILFLNLFLTKKEKIITIKSNIHKNRPIFISRYGRLFKYYNTDIINDENNIKYYYNNDFLFNALNIQKINDLDIVNLKEGNKIKITYYGLFRNTILNVSLL